MAARGTLLGFPETTKDRRRLCSEFFPSKLGGKPAWLIPEHVPWVEGLTCGECEKRGRNVTLSFVLQLYAPRGDLEKFPQAFHRSLMVFACATCGGEWTVFRAQLPRVNNFFSSIPPQDIEDIETKYETVSGCCSGCGIFNEVGFSGGECKRCTGTAPFQEFLIDIESECSDSSSEGGDVETESNDPAEEQSQEASDKTPKAGVKAVNDDRSEDELKTAEKENNPESDLIREYMGRLESDKETTLDQSELTAFEDISKSLLQTRGGAAMDPTFQQFTKRRQRHPGHVIRYSPVVDQCDNTPTEDHISQPLWFCSQNRLLSEPPPCALCGAQRIFEFQIQPDLINFLTPPDKDSSHSIDFGIVAIYTCSRSCTPPRSDKPYALEYAFSQTDPDSH